ncbi:MAG: YicC/YloC family endoribonuclease [Polyangia bacterium]
MSAALQSMTGFGRAEVHLDGRRLVVELRSVNHRFLELKVRLPREDAELEAELGKLVRARLLRGSVSLSLREEGDDPTQADGPLVDTARAKQWALALGEVAVAVGAPPPSLELVCAQQGVLRPRAPETTRPALLTAARAATDAALRSLSDTRAREGAELGRDLAGRLDTLGTLRDKVKVLADAEPELHKKKLATRLAALLDDRPGQVDPQRLAQEVALLAERLDVNEELVRLAAHLDEARRLLGGKEAAGRRLDFLSQEIHREVNTIGSKSQSTDITATVIEMKAELERFREQVQNLE